MLLQSVSTIAIIARSKLSPCSILCNVIGSSSLCGTTVKYVPPTPTRNRSQDVGSCLPINLSATYAEKQVLGASRFTRNWNLRRSICNDVPVFCSLFICITFEVSEADTLSWEFVMSRTFYLYHLFRLDELFHLYNEI
jgi:hypothetical protein